MFVVVIVIAVCPGKAMNRVYEKNRVTIRSTALCIGTLAKDVPVSHLLTKALRRKTGDQSWSDACLDSVFKELDA